ncbi:MAG: SDR family oxidoreductase [Janthinobacterium lividum]
MANSELVLVTCGTGAVGVNCILQLLQKGYAVRTTLRSLSKKVEVLAMLKYGGVASPANLSFVEADLGSDANWDQALQGCTYLLHVASPTQHEPADENAVIRPAVDGVLRVLKAARQAGVKRVVLTSSFGALGFSNHDRSTVTTEANWTDPAEKGLSAYEKSKVLAERAAWEFIKTEGGQLELAVINPVAIFGPLLGASKSPSFGLLQLLLRGTMKAVPNIVLNTVDIRDVADLHIRAMLTPEAAGHRFIASADGEISLPEIAQLLKSKLPAISGKVSSRTLPDFAVRLGALFNTTAKRGALFIKVNRQVSTANAKHLLGWQPIGTKEDAVLASAKSMHEFNMI